MRFALLSCAALLMAGLSSCVVPGNERMGGIGDSNHWALDTEEYVAVDNAIYDTLAERYGADAVQESAYPEKENHHWFVVSPEQFNGARSRVRIEGNAYRTSDGTYEPEIRVKEEVYMHADPWYKSRTNSVGEQRWWEGGRDHKLETILINEVSSKVQYWRSNGRQDTGNRRDEFRDGQVSRPAQSQDVESEGSGR